jgi:hypothetical protein
MRSDSQEHVLTLTANRYLRGSKHPCFFGDFDNQFSSQLYKRPTIINCSSINQTSTSSHFPLVLRRILRRSRARLQDHRRLRGRSRHARTVS